MRLKIKISIAVFFIGIFAAGSAFAATYKVDPDHSTVSFKIRHLFSNVQGTFNKFEGTIDYEPGKPDGWKTGGTIDVASINTNVEQRDKHLRSADFFDAAKYPAITFKSGAVKEATAASLPAGQAGAKIEGVLTMHGVEKPVVLDVTIHGVGKDPWGNVRAGFTAVTKINRKEFGLNWNETLETGQLLVGEEVMITIEAEGILQP